MQYGAGCAITRVSKGLVARSVESLVEKQFLVVERDAADKEGIYHLYLTQQCSALTEQMTEKKLRFPQAGRRHSGGSGATTEQTLRRFMENISRIY